MKSKRQHFIISVPALVPARVMRAYIIDAVETWSGQFHPDSPLFGTLRDKVRVQSMKPKKGDTSN